jgi:hypothetical protein
MIRWSLESFIHTAMGRGEITRADVHALRRDVLPNGIETRDEADLLIALDRALPEKDESWRVFMIQTVVDFVVWSSRPTGRVDRETAEWLIASLGCGTGPSDTAAAIAFEIVREAEGSDEALVAWVMRWRSRPTPELTPERASELVF